MRLTKVYLNLKNINNLTIYHLTRLNNVLDILLYNIVNSLKRVYNDIKIICLEQSSQ